MVGHDYGGMYAALLADARRAGLDAGPPGGRLGWENWFAAYWLKLADDARKEYASLFADLEPVDAVARLADRLGDRMLLQWAGKDTFVTAEARAAYDRGQPAWRAASSTTTPTTCSTTGPRSTSSRSSPSGWGHVDQN